MRLALCGSEPQLELIENLHGQSIYTERLQEQGLGVHHLGWYVEDISTAINVLANVGIQAIQSGRGLGLDGDGGFAYYQIPGVDTSVELIEVPRRRRPTEPVPAPACPPNWG
jgi:methylmalonyl-CoA/ethylmalonyl-CoA epimerase